MWSIEKKQVIDGSDDWRVVFRDPDYPQVVIACVDKPQAEALYTLLQFTAWVDVGSGVADTQ